MKINTTLELGGKTATGFAVPEEAVAELGAGRRPPVRVTVNGHTYRSTVAPMGSRHMVPVSAENRGLAGIAAGDEIQVELVLDTEVREVSVPGDLAEALKGDPAAQRFFDGLSYSKKRWFVLSVEGAKKPETRQRRVNDAVTMLREGRSR